LYALEELKPVTKPSPPPPRAAVIASPEESPEANLLSMAF
jgi:hypothetical protein